MILGGLGQQDGRGGMQSRSRLVLGFLNCGLWLIGGGGRKGGLVNSY